MTLARNTPDRSERAATITDHIYEAVKAAGGETTAIYAATLKRVRELVEATRDPDQVERVCLALVEKDGDRFVSWRSLGWGSYEYFRDMLDVPKGGWVYALAVLSAPPRYADALDFWLRCWRDAETDGDDVKVYQARQKLAGLLEALRFETVDGEQ